MWTVKVSPTAVAGSPDADISIPDASIATCPSGLDTTANTSAGVAAMARLTSMR